MDPLLKRVRLGNTDISISPIGIGTWAWGDTTIWKYGHGYGLEDIHQAFTTSLEANINFFDTAEMYGRGKSESFLGDFLRGNKREIVVATKFMPYLWRLSAKTLLSALEQSLQRLRIDAIDLYQIHWPVPILSIESLMKTMARAFRSGRIRAVGVSNYSRDQMCRAQDALAKENIPLASNQVEYSLMNRKPERNGVLDECKRNGISLIAYSPLAKGFLTGKFTPASPVPGVRKFFFRQRQLIHFPQLLSTLTALGEKYGAKTPAQVSLNWVLSKGTIAIPGAKNAKQARENVGALGWKLTDNDVILLDESSNQLQGKN
jgi:aryl-alcohol dehydrogenase-like predicted oxidoreductase